MSRPLWPSSSASISKNGMNELTKRMTFDKDTHTYKVDGITLPSVTEICSPITYHKFAVGSALVEQAAIRGTAVHQHCADYDYGLIDDDYEVDVETSLFLKAWADFCHDYQPVWEYIELPLASKDCAGTVDRIGIIDGLRTIVDIKTAQSMDRASKVSVSAQIYGYQYLALCNDIQPIRANEGMAVQLKKDGTYAVYKVKDLERKYEFNASEVWLALKDIQRIAKGGKTIE